MYEPKKDLKTKEPKTPRGLKRGLKKGVKNINLELSSEMYESIKKISEFSKMPIKQLIKSFCFEGVSKFELISRDEQQKEVVKKENDTTNATTIEKTLERVNSRDTYEHMLKQQAYTLKNVENNRYAETDEMIKEEMFKLGYQTGINYSLTLTFGKNEVDRMIAQNNKEL